MGPPQRAESRYLLSKQWHRYRLRWSSMANGGRGVEKVGDLIDVLAHGFRCGAGVALAQCRNDSFMTQDGSAWTALLLHRELARFHEQIVQCGHDADDRAIARGAREDVVKSRVLDDGRSAGFELLALRVEDALQVGKVLVGDARGRGARDGGFEHPAQVQQLVLQFITVAQDGSQRRDEPVDVELLRKCALTVARDEQTDGLQRTERVTDRPAADAEPFGKRAFRGQSLARREGAVENQHPDAVGDLFGHPRLSDRLDQTRVAGAGRTPKVSRAGWRPAPAPGQAKPVHAVLADHGRCCLVMLQDPLVAIKPDTA